MPQPSAPAPLELRALTPILRARVNPVLVAISIFIGPLAFAAGILIGASVQFRASRGMSPMPTLPRKVQVEENGETTEAQPKRGRPVL